MSGIRGDFAKLAKIGKRLAELEGVVPDTAKAAAAELVPVINAQIASGRGPDGHAWAPKKDGGTALEGMTNAVRVKATPTSIVADVTRRVPRYHQRGRSSGSRGGFMPARPFIPKPSDPIPREWEQAIAAGAERAFTDRTKEIA